MPKTVSVISERVDDIPLLVEQMHHMQLASLLNKHFVPHGNWQGLRPGELSVVWLTYILSEGDHRLNQVEAWVQDHLLTLQACLTADVGRMDASDDHLAHLLDVLSDDVSWANFEQACAQTLLRTYALVPHINRVDSTSASGYGTVTPDGLFQFGHSKDHRPDLPQVKINLATLDPLGLPLVIQVVPGQSSDDPLYLPAIRQAQACLHQRGLTHVGDSKMGALDTRAYIHQSGDYYLMPLGLVQVPATEIDKRLVPVWRGQQRLTPVYSVRDAVGQREKLAIGFEWREPLTAAEEDTRVHWTERRLLIRSLSYAAAQEKALRARLAQAHQALIALDQRGRGRRHYPTIAALQDAAQAIVSDYAVAGLLKLTYHAEHTQREVRAYGPRAAHTEESTDYQLRVQVRPAPLAHAIRRLGWRVYATNQPATTLTLPQAVLAYRQQYREERGFGRLKGRALALTPMYLAADQRVTGLIRLLSLGLRVLTLVEFEVRRSLQTAQAELAGLYAGQPKRVTTTPTTEQLLRAFKGITLIVWRSPTSKQSHLTPLSPVHRRILKLLKFPATLYSRLERQSLQLAPKMGEP
jgi:transposase